MNPTICAPATAQGGAIGIIRVSGPEAISITDSIFRGKHSLKDTKGYTVHYGKIVSSPVLSKSPSGSVLDNSAVEFNNTSPVLNTSNFGSVLDSSAVELILDEVLVTIFRAPHSYTGEDSVEISCHGSSYIINTIINLLCQQGCQLAAPGEYTKRAFLNGKLDLSQAEAVADLIASQNSAQHRVAISQLRGGISLKLQELRDRLLHLTSLLELELDFSDHEDLEFADRSELLSIAQQVAQHISHLLTSFQQGNAIKNGIPVAIIGAPNVGKSTLLNALLEDDKAIVSDIQGTTRDTIEDTIYISSHQGGHEVSALFRFIDTAGIRHTDDTIENLGIKRSLKAAEKAQIIILMRDPDNDYPTLSVRPDQTLIHVFNKSDQSTPGSALDSSTPGSVLDSSAVELENTRPVLNTSNFGSVLDSSAVELFPLYISAKAGTGLSALKSELLKVSTSVLEQGQGEVITNQRHQQALLLAKEDIDRAISAMQQALSGDLISEDLRQCITHLSEITGGEITPDEVLGNIFSHFCIGK